MLSWKLEGVHASTLLMATGPLVTGRIIKKTFSHRLRGDPIRLRNSAKGNESESCTSVQTPLAEVFWEGMFHGAPARKGIFQHVAGKQHMDRVRAHEWALQVIYQTKGYNLYFHLRQFQMLLSTLIARENEADFLKIPFLYNSSHANSSFEMARPKPRTINERRT